MNQLFAEANPAYLQVSYHYDGAGRPIDRILSNGAHTRYGWDQAGRLIQPTNTTVTGQVVNNTTYTRDWIGNILTQSETAGTGQTQGTTSYSYDPGYRLKSADRPGTASDEAYTYDKVGNRKTATFGALVANASTRHYAYDAGNRLQTIRIGSIAGTIESSFTYDDNGSLTAESGPRAKTVTWNAQNRPITITANGFTDSFQYDPAGHRIQKADSQGSTTYLLEGEHLEAIYNTSAVVQAQYLRGSVIDEIVNGYQLDGGKLVNYTYHHDALQSVLGQSGHAGSILSTQSYGAFGNVLSSSGNSPNKLKFTGREEDPDTGLYYYRARYYDYATGRFVSEDPKGFAAGVNFYAYCSNNPVNCNDPSGLDPYTSTYSSYIGAAIAATQDIIAKPDSIKYEYGGFVYPNQSKPQSYSYTSLVTQNQKHEVKINTELLPVSARVYSGIPPMQIHSHPLGVEKSFSKNIDIPNAQKNAELLIKNGISFPYTEFMYSFEAGNLKQLTINKPGNTPIIDPIWWSPSSDPLKLNSLENFQWTPFNSSANGGFVIYPNKSNTNITRSVYSK